MSIRNRGGSDFQSPDFIQDMNRFQLPSEGVADEMGEEPPTLVGGLPVDCKSTVKECGMMKTQNCLYFKQYPGSIKTSVLG